MLAYAANAPRFAERGRSPKALLLIVGAHVAALAVLMTAKMDIIPIDRDGIDVTFVDPVRPPPDPTPPPPSSKSQQQPSQSRIDRPESIVPLDPVGPIALDPPVQLPPLGPIAGTGSAVVPVEPVHSPVRVAARFATPDWALKPPYPDSKRESEEEATLKLRLSIDDQGRVIAVEPVGTVDPVFLASARKHLIAKWRYRPATEDGQPVPSSTIITLRFELES